MIGTILYSAGVESCRVVKDSAENKGNSPVSCNLKALSVSKRYRRLTRYRENVFVVWICEWAVFCQ